MKKFKLRTRLFVTFTVMTILPIIICVIIGFTLMKLQTSRMEEAYGMSFEDGSIDGLYAPTYILGNITDEVFEDIQHTIEKTPQKLQDKKYLDELSTRLSKRLSKMVVRVGGEIFYSTSDMDNEKLYEFLPPEDDDDVNNSGIYKGGDNPCIIKQVTFVNESDVMVTVSLITPLNQAIPQMKILAIDILIAIILILAIVNFNLCMWIYHSILVPLNKLKLATSNIKTGNFDFEMPKIPDEDIGSVYRDFEEMRQILKQSSEDKIKSDAEERELIRNISHDLKTPLTAIKGYVEGLIDGVADTPEKQMKYMKTIYNKACDMDKLIDELTIYSKLDTNRVAYTFTPINLRAYFEDCVEEIGMDLDAQNIKLEYHYRPKEDIIVVADAEQFKRVVNNIVSNSVKYMKEGRDGIIKIDIYDDGDYAHIVLEDNGKGIGVAELPHVFERFYRTDSSRNSRKGGSGIGLAIVKKIIEDHKGKIWAESVEGEGTTMHICLLKGVKELKG